MNKHHDYDWLYSRYITNGMSAAAIGEDLGYSQSTILKWLDRYDLTRRKSPKLSQWNVLWILCLLDSTIPQKEIARVYNVSESTISRIKAGERWPDIYARWQEIRPQLQQPAPLWPPLQRPRIWWGKAG